MFHTEREGAPQPFLPERIRDRGLVSNVQLFPRAPPSPHCAGRAQNGETGLSLHVPLQLLHLRRDHQVNFFMGCDCHIEVFFRTFKHPFGCRNLRSRSAAHAQLELEWALVGVWGICLLGRRELRARGQEPARFSPAAALHAFQGTLHEYRVRPDTAAETLWAQLRRARLDDYQRRSSTMSRASPRNKHPPPIGIPHISLATQQQIAQAAALQNKEAFRFAA
jgi:hypothetical protein